MHSVMAPLCLLRCTLTPSGLGLRQVATLSCTRSQYIFLRTIQTASLKSVFRNDNLTDKILPSRPLFYPTRWFGSGAFKIVDLPSMGDSITEGTLNHWKKNVGEIVAADDIVAVVDTDKVSVDITTPQSGKLIELYAKEGDVVLVGSPLVKLDCDVEISPNSVQGVQPPAASTAAPSTAAPSTAAPSTAAPSTAAPSTAAPSTATPLTAAPSTTAASPSPPSSSNLSQPMESSRTEKRVPMSRIRRTIADRLKNAQNTAAMLSTFNECDMGAIMALRSEMNETFKNKNGIKMGFVSAFMLASALSLKKFPQVNAFIDGNDIVYKDYADISVAVATPTGLMVPVIKDCHQKSWAQLEKDLADLAVRARSNKIALEEMVGGTFTVSNGGVYGSMLGTPLLNPPQSSILGMHAIKKRAVVKNDQIVIRPMMYLALTYDHRLIDGKDAVTFLSSIRDYIEDPRLMLLDL